MLAVVGFGVGFVMGARAGQEGLERILVSGRQVLASEEFKALLETAQSLGGSLLREGMSRVVGRAAGEARDLGGRLRAA